MQQSIERRATPQVKYRINPTIDAERLMRRARLQRAAELLIEGLGEAGRDKPLDQSHRIRFLYFADRQNRDAIVDNAAAILITRAAADNKVINPEHAERFVWHNLRQHFHWQHVADLEPRGTA